MMNLALDENKVMFIRYKLNDDKCAEITFDNGSIVDINIVEKDQATKTIESLVENNSDVKKIREIISKDKELDDYVNKSRRKLAKNIIEYNQEWSVSPEEEEEAMEQYLNKYSSGDTSTENNE
jgi:hypothetical protein